MFIDTHAHINLLVTDFDTPLTPNQYPFITTIVREAEKKGVTQIINVGTNLIESYNSSILAKNFSSIFAAIGIHPTDWHPHYKKDFVIFQQLLKENKKIVAIGECGLDLYHQKVLIEKQISLFHSHVELALLYKKPLVIHSRDAYDKTLKILEEYCKEPISGVIHCFSYDYDFAKTVISWNFALGIGGTVTYPKNNELRQAVQKVPLTSIVLETDTPFLPMQSMRGKKNHPQHIADIAQHVAELREIEFEVIEKSTTETAQKLFKI